jgi:uncharacterized protein with NRDE domain
MCVLAFAWDIHPRFKLLLAGNRDETYARPSAPLARWADAPGLLAGRDLEAGGTWMGVHELDRAAVVTNVRDPRVSKDGASRGLLVSDFLRGDTGAAESAEWLATDAARYRPFNLLLFDRDDARFVSNHPGVCSQSIAPGVHGLSNGKLDEVWPKVRRATAALQSWMDAGADTTVATLFEAFRDVAVAPDDDLPDTGIGLVLERQLSPVFVSGARYGTRATTLIALNRAGGGCIIERRFGPHGAPAGQTTLRMLAES